MVNKLYIDNIDLEITERCSLKCKYCFNCMQYYEKPKDIPLEIIKWETEELLSELNGIGEIRVLGGEPFMHKDLSKIVDFLHTLSDKITSGIWIFTNATILPNEEQLRSFTKSRSKFYISDYGLDKKQRIAEFCQILNRWGIEYEVHKLCTWYNPGTISCNNKNVDELKNMYSDCWGRDCITLLDGKLFQCEIIANANRLGLLPDFPEDYVDLRKKESLRERLDYFLNEMDHMRSCQYCNLTYDNVTPGEQLR